MGLMVKMKMRGPTQFYIPPKDPTTTRPETALTDSAI